MGPAARHSCCRWWPRGIFGGVWTWHHWRWSLAVSLDSFHFLCWSSDQELVHQISELGALQPLLAALMTSVFQDCCLNLQFSKFAPKNKKPYWIEMLMLILEHALSVPMNITSNICPSAVPTWGSIVICCHWLGYLKQKLVLWWFLRKNGLFLQLTVPFKILDETIQSI